MTIIYMKRYHQKIIFSRVSFNNSIFKRPDFVDALSTRKATAVQTMLSKFMRYENLIYDPYRLFLDKWPNKYSFLIVLLEETMTNRSFVVMITIYVKYMRCGIQFYET